LLVTDSMGAMGLPSGNHQLGTLSVSIEGNRAYLKGTTTLAGSVVTMDECVRNFMKFTGAVSLPLSLSLDFIVIIIVSVDLKNHLVGCAECSIVEAVEAASLHPAQVLGIADRKGTLNVGAEADFVLLDADMRVRATFVGGELAWSSL